jgi:kinesin family protein 11
MNKRAKEAGMINQSLLTLGRVITALTEHTPHIPYRESKLTRLLQDSLGGKTRTCIVATISPSVLNIEETLSTLEYSMRAKSIRNKPELNMKISKAAMIRELNTDMEKLKLELQNQRNKCGVYLSVEQHQEILQQITNLGQEIADLKNQNKVTKEDIDEITRQFLEKKAALESEIYNHNSTRNVLTSTQTKLSQTETELAETQLEVAEKHYVIQEHQKTEKILYGQASNTVDNLRESYCDIEQLESKVDRKSRLESENFSHVEQFKVDMDQGIARTEGNLTRFQDTYGRIQESMHQTISAFVQAKKNNIDNVQTHLLQLQNNYAETSNKVSELVASRSTQNIANMNTVSTKHEEHSAYVTGCLAKLQDMFAKGIHGVQDQLRQYQRELTDMNSFIGSSVNKHTHAVNEFVMDHGKLMNGLRDNVAKSTESQVAALQSYQNNFHQMITKTRQDNIQMKDAFMKSMETMLSDNLKKQEAGLDDRIVDVNRFVDNAVYDVNNFRNVVNANTNTACSRVDVLAKNLITVSEEMGNTTSSVVSGMKNAMDSTLENVDGITGLVMGNSTKLVQETKDHAQLVDKTINAEREQLTSFSDRFANTIRDRGQQFNNQQQGLVQQVNVFDQIVLDGFVGNNNEGISQVSQEISLFAGELGCRSSAIRSDVNNFVINYKIDRPTGSTPRKRKRDASTELTRSRPYEDLCSEFRATLIDNNKENLAGVNAAPVAGLTLDCENLQKSDRSCTPTDSSPASATTPKVLLFSSATPTKDNKKRRKMVTSNGPVAGGSKLKRTNSSSNINTHAFR